MWLMMLSFASPTSRHFFFPFCHVSAFVWIVSYLLRLQMQLSLLLRFNVAWMRTMWSKAGLQRYFVSYNSSIRWISAKGNLHKYGYRNDAMEHFIDVSRW